MADIAVTLLLTRDGIDVTGEVVAGRILNAPDGDYVATWKASDGVLPDVTKTASLTVLPAVSLAAVVTPDPLVAGQSASITFNVALTQAPTATGGITFTGSGTTWDFVVPEDATSITIGASLAGYTSYGETLEVQADPNSYTILRTPDYMLGIDTAMTSGTTPFEVTQAQDSRYIGAWAPDKAELQAGPVFLTDPFIDDDEPVAAGMQAIGVSALFDFTPKLTGDPVDIAWTLEVDGAPKGDGLYGFGSNRLRQQITDANGTRSRLSAPVVLSAPTTMARNSVLFNGTSKLQHFTSLGDTVTSFLMFAQFTKKGTQPRQNLLNIGGTSAMPLGTWDSDAIRSGWLIEPSGSLIAGLTQSGTIVADQRASLLVCGHLSANGNDLVIDVAHLRNNALAWVQGSITGASKTAFRLFNASVAGFSLGSAHLAGAGFDNPWYGLNHRLALWTNTGTVDVSSGAVRNLFLAQGTDDLMDIQSSYGAFGQPLIDLYGPAADYNAKILNGSIGTADTLVGTFTNG